MSAQDYWTVFTVVENIVLLAAMARAWVSKGDADINVNEMRKAGL